MFAMHSYGFCSVAIVAKMLPNHSASKEDNMQAIIQKDYGEADVLRLSEIDIPEPSADEVRVRIGASSVTAADTMMRRGTPWYGRLFIGLLKPKFPVPGTGFSGVVDKAGAAVTGFTVGDRVYGESVLGAGTNCEYVCVPEKAVIVHSPDNIADNKLAPVCDGMVTSYYFLFIAAGIPGRQRVLVNGAAGSLGSAAVQLAKIAGAHVTAVCSERNFELVRELGADVVIDYHNEDFTRSSASFDIVYDAVGKQTYRACKRVLTSSGMYLSPVLSLSLLWSMFWTKHAGNRRAIFAATGLLPEKQRREMLSEINGWIASGELRTVLEHRFALAEIAEAHRLIETGHRRGNVVLEMV